MSAKQWRAKDEASWADKVAAFPGGEVNAIWHMPDSAHARMAWLESRIARLADPKFADTLAERFIAWPLPASVRSDLIVTMSGEKHRTGTNLLTFDEARQMMREVVMAVLNEEAWP